MNEQPASDFLGALRKAISNTQLYPDEHPYSVEAVERLSTTAKVLTEDKGEATVSVLDGAFYLNRHLLPNASLEHRSVVATLQDHGLESVTIKHSAAKDDLRELSRFLGRESIDLPATGSVTLNERPYTKADVREAAKMSKLRKSYASSIDILRGVSAATVAGEQIELSASVWAVEDLLEQVLAEQSASLLLSTVKTHDQYTFFHCVNTAILAIALGRSIGIDESDLPSLGLGALLHDLGKVQISPEIIQYPGRLDDHQWAEIHKHPQEGALAILAAAGESQELAARVALEHHARFDLTGYPAVSGRSRLHLYSRIVSVCDVYDALTTRRSYKRAEPPHRALDLIVQGAGSHLDPDVVHAFVHMMGIYPTGSLVRIRTGEVLMVINAEQQEERLLAVALRGPDGEEREDFVAREVDMEDIAGLILPEQIGVNPASLLEKVHVLDLDAAA